MTRIAPALAFVVSLVMPPDLAAQIRIRADQPDLAIDAKVSRQVIEETVKHLNKDYVFPETAKKVETDLLKRLETNEYDQIKSAQKLSETLTEHLQVVTKDKHLRVFYSHEPIPVRPEDRDSKVDRGKTDPMLEEMRERGRAINFGFEKTDRLEGNVGYLELNMFFPAAVAGQTAAAAMNLLANTDALIIDLRKNGGGEPGMVALLCTYLFDPEPVHLNDLYFRPDNSTHQWWTLPLVPGQRYENKPVYVLTSKRTFSAAEEFTYNLKCLKRATIVGETTGGGAHPGGMVRLTVHFGMFVPSGRAINPITKTNWEGTGVSPDVAVPAERALTTAHLAALKRIASDLAASAKEPKHADPMRVEQINKTIERLEKELKNPTKASESGGYQGRRSGVEP
jgi:C-terminal processing protease CtpA/Prc